MSLGLHPAVGHTGNQGHGRGRFQTLCVCLQLHRPWGAHCESGPVTGPPAVSQGHPTLESIEELVCVLSVPRLSVGSQQSLALPGLVLCFGL